jgi:hypothetical protein
MATFAAVVAVAGGTAYAVDKINGSQIKNHSIASSKLKKDVVVPRARVADQTEQLLVSGGTALPGAKRAIDVADGGGLIRMSVGDSVVVFEEAPLTFTATCTGDPGGTVTITEYATSTQSWTDPLLQTHDAGEQVSLLAKSGDKPEFNLFVPAFAVAADGTTVATSETELGVHAFGSDCAIFQYAVT